MSDTWRGQVLEAVIVAQATSMAAGQIGHELLYELLRDRPDRLAALARMRAAIAVRMEPRMDYETDAAGHARVLVSTILDTVEARLRQ